MDAISYLRLGHVFTAMMTGNTVIDGAECVTKTYPEFWDVFKNLGGKVQTDG